MPCWICELISVVRNRNCDSAKSSVSNIASAWTLRGPMAQCGSLSAELSETWEVWVKFVLGCSGGWHLASYTTLIWQKVCLFIEHQVFYGLLSIFLGVSHHDYLAKPENMGLFDNGVSEKVDGCENQFPHLVANLWEVNNPISDTHDTPDQDGSRPI